MNKDRRKEIQNIIDKIEDLKEEIENVMNDEQEYIDNMPENLQGSEKCEAAESAVYNMESAYDYLTEACEALETARE